MLEELIDEFYLEQQKNSSRLHFYITDAGKCPRAVFFKFKNAPEKKMDARILRIFEQGEFFHRNIFNVLYRLKIGVTTEVKIPTQEIISGRADAIICINNQNYVLDIKSMNSMIFRNLKESKLEHIYQIQLYLHFFNIKKGILLYIDKDQQNIKEFVVDYDAKLCKNLMDDFGLLKEKIEMDLVPCVLSDYPRNWQCRYCQYKEICDMARREQLKWSDLKKKINEDHPR